MKDLVTEKQVSSIILNEMSETVIWAERFPTGLCHFVFDVRTSTGNTFVVRIARPENRNLLQSAIYWNEIFRQESIPLPKIYAFDLSAELPYLILERLPGKDLGQVYGELSTPEKEALAKEITRIQAVAASMPKANSFGYLENYDVPGSPEWFDVVIRIFERSRSRIESAGCIDNVIVDKVEKLANRYKDYFSTIEPTAFFDDITTKNVIINEGRLSGIVDIDWMCFGDSVQTIGLTQTSLLASGDKTDYITFLCDEADLDTEQREVLNFYSAMYCVDFLAEVGQNFNRREPIAADQKKIDRLLDVLNNLLSVM